MPRKLPCRAAAGGDGPDITAPGKCQQRSIGREGRLIRQANQLLGPRFNDSDSQQQTSAKTQSQRIHGRKLPEAREVDVL